MSQIQPSNEIGVEPMIDRALLAVLSRVESSDNQYAMRFEPAVFGRAPNFQLRSLVQKCNHCSQATAQMIYSTSWGQYQIMGFNIYTYFRGSIWEWMNEPDQQKITLCRFLDENGVIDYTLDTLMSNVERRMKFIRIYNGPGAMEDYWALMLKAALALGLSDVQPALKA
jgi:N-acetylmuramidase-like protein